MKFSDRMYIGLSRLEQLLDAGNRLAKQDDAWHIFAPDGEGVECGATLLELILQLAEVQK